MNVEATVVVDFNGGSVDDSTYLFMVELDDISNDDETSFDNGDQPVFRVNHSSNVTITDVVSTDGSARYIGSDSRTKEEITLFASRDDDELSTYQLSVIPSTYSVSYAGRTGVLTSDIVISDIIEFTGDVSKTPFLATFSINYAAALYELIPPTMDLSDDKDYTIHIVFYIQLEG